MGNKKSEFYDLNECKTEFLFESDAEKVVLNEAAKKIKPKFYKKILLNSIIISFFTAFLAICFSYYKDIEIEKINASIVQKNKVKTNNYIVNEKMNSSSDELKTITGNYNNKYEIIVNKANVIDEDVIKSYNIVSVEDNLFNDVKLEEKTYKQYLKLKDNLKERGYYINIRSGFRTFDESNLIYNNYVTKMGEDYANKYVAKPGVSEHNIGIAFDFIISTDENSTKTNYDSYEYTYLENIAYLYGFIIRYPKDKEAITGYSYEPWHLRYVGTSLAKYLKKNNLTLEEYYE